MDCKSSQSNVSIYNLPPYILIHIFRFVNQKDLLFSVRNTCRLWNHLSREKVLWRTLDVQNFPDYAFTPKLFLDLLRNTSDGLEGLHFDVLQHDLKIIKHEGIYCSSLKEVCIGIQKRNNHFTSNSISTVDINNGLLRLSEKYPNLVKLCVINQVLLFEDIFRNLQEFVYESIDRSVGRIRAREFLGFHQCLKQITLRKCILSVETVTKILKEYKELELLDLCGSTTMFDEINNSIGGEEINVDKLKSLNLSETDVVDGLLMKIARKAHGLQYLNIAKCQRLTNATVEVVAKNATCIRTLIINVDDVTLSEGQCDVTFAGIERVAENCPYLTVLKINHCPEVGNSGVAAVVKTCHQLVELEIAGCLSLQDATVLSLVNNCPRIQRLNLGGCPQLTGKSASCVLKQCKNLKYLNIETCHRVTDLRLSENEVNGSDLFATEDSQTNLRGQGEIKVLDLSESLKHEDNVQEKEKNYDDTCKSERLEQHNKEEEMRSSDVHLSDRITSMQCLELLKNHSHVTVLNLSFCSKISNSCVKQIACHCSDLRELDIQACYMVTNAGVRELLKFCRFLRILNISGGSVFQTSRLTDECLQDIVEYGKSITKLTAVKNYNFTAEAVFNVIEKSDLIQSVNVEVSKRSNISKEMLIELSGRVKDKTICLQFRADVEILVFKDAEFKIRQRYQ